MKGLLKKITVLTLSLVMFLPVFVNADVDLSNFTSQKLEDTLKEEEIEYDFNHTDSADQVVIYLFRGRGCAYCRKFLEYASNTLMKTYENKIRIVTYEVWYDEYNGVLYEGIAQMLGASSDGVPFIVIGSKYFTGYSESMNSDITAAIDAELSSTSRYDALAEYVKYSNEQEEAAKKANKVDLSDAIVWNLIFTAASTVIIIVYINKKFEKIYGKKADSDEYEEPLIESKKK